MRNPEAALFPPDSGDPFNPEFVRWSHISSYAKCPQQFWLRYRHPDREHLQRPSGPLKMGILMHDFIEMAERMELWGQDDAFAGGRERFGQAPRASTGFLIVELHAEMMKIYDETPPEQFYWGGRKTNEYPFGEDQTWWWAMAPIFLRRMNDLRVVDRELGMTMDMETLESRLIGNFWGERLGAKLDGMLWDVVGRPRIRDTKTGQKGNADPMQLAMYAGVVQQVLELPSLPEAEMAYLRGSTREAQLVAVDVETLWPQVEPMVRWFLEAERSGLYPCRPSNLCKACDVKLACPIGSLYPDS